MTDTNKPFFQKESFTKETILGIGKRKLWHIVNIKAAVLRKKYGYHTNLRLER